MSTKKPEFNEVLKIYRNNNCELLEKKYVNARTLMKFKCKCGNTYEKHFYAFKVHPFCNLCGKTTKYTQTEAMDLYKKYNCTLLSQYNSTQKLEYKCSCGEIESKTFKAFKINQKCNKCCLRHKYSFEEVQKIFLKNKCTLLEKEYLDTKTKMKYQCECGNKSEIRLDKFLKGGRCKTCGIRNGEKNGRWNPNRKLVELNKILAQRSLAYLKHLLNKQGKQKQLKMKSYLGYSVFELRDRITQHPNWDKVKNTTWHIDHIFPTKAFLENGISDLKIINSLDNLQPLTEQQNLSKSAKYNKEEFKKWLFLKGITL